VLAQNLGPQWMDLLFLSDPMENLKVVWMAGLLNSFLAKSVAVVRFLNLVAATAMVVGCPVHQHLEAAADSKVLAVIEGQPQVHLLDKKRVVLREKKIVETKLPMG
jgi:hypothetical protein